MRFALDKEGNRTFIDGAHSKEDYFCPACKEKLVLKKGKNRAHHFAHPAHSRCSDTWNYDMSDWHIAWQNRFPPESQEVILNKGGKKHRADVCLEDRKVVYEFQHSSLSSKEFEERNDFYSSLGYKVIWIFDLSNQYANELIENYCGNKFKWSRPIKTFDCFIPQKRKNIHLYFQISP